MNRHDRTCVPPGTRIDSLTRRELISSAFATALLIACGDDDDEAAPPASGGDTRLVRHSLGESTVPLRPERVVTLWRPTLAAAVMLGFRPVGSVGDAETEGFGLTTYLPEDFPVDELQLVGPQREYDLEKIAALQPDLIIGVNTSAGQEQELYPRLSEIAATVMAEWLGTESWRDHLVRVAEALGVPEKADAVVRDYGERVGALRSESSIEPSTLEVSLVRIQGPGVLRLETPASFPGQVIEDIGFRRPEVQLTPDEDRDFIEISLERIRDADADLVFVFHNADNASAWEEVRQNPLWQDLSATKADKINVFQYEWWGAANYYGAFRILEDVQSVLTQG